MPDLMNQRGRYSASNHALTGNPDDCHRIFSASGQACACAADRCPEAPVKIRCHIRLCEIFSVQGDGILCQSVQTGKPYAILVFAPLCQHIREYVELCQHSIELHSQKTKAPLRFNR